jgi:hypothetical protein
MKKIAVGNLGQEEKDQFRAKTISRAQTRAEADALFTHKATEIASDNQKYLKQHFVQAPGAETAPTLAKTAAVDLFFTLLPEKIAEAQLTDAQRRYPELLKVAAAPGGRGSNPTPTLKRVSKTEIPTAPMLSGGSA